MTLEDLIIRISIEKDNRMAKHRERLDLGTKANFIEENSSGKNFVENLPRLKTL